MSFATSRVESVTAHVVPKEEVLRFDVEDVKAKAQKHFREKRYRRAVQLWKQGATKKDSTCLFNLGCCLERGLGIARDPAEAAKLYGQAGQMNHATALYNLALLHVRGDGVFRDVHEAVALLKQAARLGHVDAGYNAGQLLLSSDMTKTQPGEQISLRKKKELFADALVCFEEAADRGHAFAMHSLGLCYMAGGPGLDADEHKGFEMFQQASKFGCVEALFHVGLCYELGQGIDRDIPTMIQTYRQAFALGHLESLFRLATCYETGVGSMVPCPRLAFETYQQAAELGHVEAMTHCGICYESGTGTDKDLTHAIQWYHKASTATPQPSALALFRLGRLQFRHELAEATVACLQQEMREDKIIVEVEESVQAASILSLNDHNTGDGTTKILGASVKPKSKSPPPSPRRDDTSASDHNDGSASGSGYSQPAANEPAPAPAPAPVKNVSHVQKKSDLKERLSSGRKSLSSRLSQRQPSSRPNSARPATSKRRVRTGVRSTRSARKVKVNNIDYLYKSDLELGTRPNSDVVAEFVGHTTMIGEMLGRSVQRVKKHKLPPEHRVKLNATVPTETTENLLQKAFKMWSQTVKEDPTNSVALYYLGLCHEVGAGTAINPELAIEYYQQASESNPSHAAALFGEAMAMLRARPGQERVEGNVRLAGGSDFTATSVGARPQHVYDHAAKLLWRAWVSQHHTDALFNLGVLYENDLIAIDEITPPTDFRAAFCKRTKPLLNSNSSVDDEDFELEELHFVPPSQHIADIALHALQVTAMAGHEADALAAVGEGITADSVVAQLDKAFVEAGYNTSAKSFFRQPVSSQSVASESTYTFTEIPGNELWISPQVIEKTNLGAAITCYQTVAMFGHKEAMVNLGLCFGSGRGVGQNDAMAMQLFSSAAEAGIPAALFFKGVFLETGRGLDPIRGVADLKAAFECYKEAALLGHHRALHNLGIFYSNGFGMESCDLARAVDCFRWAVRLGNRNALCDLGVCLKVGRGVKKDVEIARSLFQRAAALGHPDANLLLEMDRPATAPPTAARAAAARKRGPK